MGRLAMRLATGFAMAGLAACQTASLEDAAPKPGTAAVVAQETAQPSNAAQKSGVGVISPIPVPFNQPEKVESRAFVESGVAKGGKFPNLGENRTAALPQMTKSESEALKQEFEAVKQSGPKGAQTDAAYRRRLAELRRLAKSHASEAEAEIAN